MRVDMHTHILPAALPDWASRFGGNSWPELIPDGPDKALLRIGTKASIAVDSRFWNAELRIEHMDRTNIDIQIVSQIPMMACYWADIKPAREIARFFNEQTAEFVAQHPQRFRGMGTVPLQDTESAIDELRYIHEKLGINSVQIGTCPNNRDLDDEELFPFFQACAELGIGILVHPIGIVAGRNRMNDYYLPNTVGNPIETTLAMSRFVFGGVLDKLPGLKICFAHCGGAFSFVLGRLDKAYEISPDARQNIASPPSAYATRIFVDNLTFDPSAVRLGIEKHGKNRILLGSDYPFGLGEDDPASSLIDIGLTAGEIKQISENNIEEFIDL